MEEINDSSDKINENGEIEDMEWTPDKEILLLYSLNGHKPVGPVKHFNMLVIQERLCNAMNKSISSKAIWKKLNDMYDLEALDEAEAEQSALENVDTDFSLPGKEFGEMMNAIASGKSIKIKVEKDEENYQNNAVLQLSEIKKEPQTELENEAHVGPRGGTKSPRKEGIKKVYKKKEAIALKENVAKKDVNNKRESIKELKKVAIKEETKKEPVKKTIQEGKKEMKGNKKESTSKNVPDQTIKEVDAKKVDQRKTPNQRGTGNQLSRVVRSETPKSIRTETAKIQKADSLKKSITAEKKKEAIETAEGKSPEKPQDPGRGSKLRTRERKITESETQGTKRERSKDTSATEEPAAKKAKITTPKGRPTRNSLVEPQQKPASPVSSPQKRRTRP